MIYFERVSSIGIPQQQHPFLEASRYSLAKEPYLKKEVILTALAVVAVTLVVFAGFSCPFVPLAVLGVVALIAPAATFFLKKKGETAEKSNPYAIHPSLQETKAAYERAMKNLVNKETSVLPFSGDLCKEVALRSTEDERFYDLSRDGLFIKTVEKEYVLAPASRNYDGLEKVVVSDKGSFSDKLQELLQSNGITDENQRKKIIDSFSQKISGDFINKLQRIFANNAFGSGIFVLSGSSGEEEAVQIPGYGLDLTTKGVAKITFNWQSRVQGSDMKILGIIKAAITIADHRTGKASYTFSLTEPAQN